MSTFKSLVDEVGGQAELARRLSVSRQTVCGWQRRGIPIIRALEIERVLGIPKERVRPDIFGPERDKAA